MSDHESAGPPADDELTESQRALVERLRTLKWPEPSPEARERGWRMLRNMALGIGAPLEADGDRNGDRGAPTEKHADEQVEARADGEAPAPPPQVSPRRRV